jgi:hypothetical protein
MGAQVEEHGSLKRVPAEAVANVRNAPCLEQV